MKIIFISFQIILLSFSIHAQTNIFKKNTQADFEVLWTSETTSFDVPISVFIIQLKDKAIDTLKIEDLNKKEVLSYLHNKDYDWYTNLLLYQITKRRGVVLYYVYNIINRDIWIKKLYDYDLEYWEDLLKE